MSIELDRMHKSFYSDAQKKFEDYPAVSQVQFQQLMEGVSVVGKNGIVLSPDDGPFRVVSKKKLENQKV